MLFTNFGKAHDLSSCQTCGYFSSDIFCPDIKKLNIYRMTENDAESYFSDGIY
jgi:hypothetical protein